MLLDCCGGVSRQQDDLEIGAHAVAQCRDDLRAELTVSQVIVGYEQLRGTLSRRSHGFGKRGDRGHAIALDTQQHAGRVANAGVILDQQNVRATRRRFCRLRRTGLVGCDVADRRMRKREEQREDRALADLGRHLQAQR